MKFALVENTLLEVDTIIGIILYDEGEVYISSSNESVLGVLKVFLEKNREIRVNLKDPKDEKITRSRVLHFTDEDWLEQIRPRILSPFSITKIGEVKDENNFASALGRIKESFNISFENEDIVRIF